MEITFSDKDLRECANDAKRCQKEMGMRRTKLYQMRLGDLDSADTLEDVRNLPGRYHELKGDRKGRWACDLDHPYRLVFVPHEEPIPVDDHGSYVWIEIKGVEIIEITDYH